MKYLSDLKIGDTVWEVYRDSIYKKKVQKLSIVEVSMEGGSTFKLELNTSNIADRIIDSNGNTLCLTLEDACIVAKLNCFEKIKEHIKIIKEKGAAIEAIGLRINELNDLKYE